MIITIFLISHLIYETKELFNAGGFANPIAYALYKMNASFVLAYLIPEDLKPIARIIKLIVAPENEMNQNTTGNYSLLHRFSEAASQGSTRRRSLTRSRDHTHGATPTLNLAGYSSQ